MELLEKRNDTERRAVSLRKLTVYFNAERIVARGKSLV